MRNKKGEEMVEAAMVLPLLILTVLSLILLIIYYYCALNCQIDLHRSQRAEASGSKAVYRVIKDEKSVSKEMGGIITMMMRKEINSEFHILRPAAIVRTGEMIVIDGNE